MAWGSGFPDSARTKKWFGRRGRFDLITWPDPEMLAMLRSWDGKAADLINMALWSGYRSPAAIERVGARSEGGSIASPFDSTWLVRGPRAKLKRELVDGSCLELAAAPSWMTVRIEIIKSPR